MPNSAVSALTALTGANVAVASDYLYIVDTSAGTSGSKKILIEELFKSPIATFQLADAGSTRWTTDGFITRYAAKQLMISGDGTGATTNTGLILGYQGTSGYGALWASSLVPTTSNYALTQGSAGNTILNAASAQTLSFNVAGDTKATVTATGVQISDTMDLSLVNKTMIRVAPTLASGGCTTPTAVTSNGSAAFSIGVGTSRSGSQPLVFTLPAATTGWSCSARNATNAATIQPAQSSVVSTTSVTITAYSRTLGTAVAWNDSDVVVLNCLAY